MVRRSADPCRTLWTTTSTRCWGSRCLDAIGDEDVQHVKAKLSHRSAKTINNVLLVLSRVLRIAVKWKVIDRMPCMIELLKTAKPTPAFYEFDHYERLAEAASKIDLRTLVVVLLGGDAGLRRGEMLGLRWSDVDFQRRQLVVAQGVWEGKDPKGLRPGRHRITDLPKGGRGRVVPAGSDRSLERAAPSFRRNFWRDDGDGA
jgi:integrase